MSDPTPHDSDAPTRGSGLLWKSCLFTGLMLAAVFFFILGVCSQS